MRDFKWYRKLKGGKWWYVRSYEDPQEYFWLHEDECDSYCWNSWFSFDRGHSFYGWKDMEDKPSEDWK